LYKVDASAVKSGSDKEIRESLLRIVEPIGGDVTIDHYDVVQDSNHRVVSYKVWVHR
jgi:hypothetical protein